MPPGSPLTLPLFDYHVHLRGGMTVEKALARRNETGFRAGVLRNLGQGWPLETDAQLQAFLDSVADKPVLVGVQVNDRDWHEKHSPELLNRLDYVLADTMIMPMPTDADPPVKLWMAESYRLDDPEAWMERYVRHTLQVLSEPIDILANPTYLPPAVADRYDELWTETRMGRVVDRAVAKGVALEIPARSEYPQDRFIRLAKERGARFCFGSNNFDDQPVDMSRCLQVIDRFALTEQDLYVADKKG